MTLSSGRIRSLVLYVVTTIFAPCIAVFTGYGQLSTPTYSRQLLPGARASAMADAGIAGTGDVAMMFWNPAGIAFDQTFSILGDYVNAPDEGASLGLVAAELPMHTAGAIALAGSMSYLLPSQSQPNITHRPQVYGFDIAYAKEILPGLGIGARFHGQTINSTRTLTAVSMAIGVTYHPAAEISYGLVYGGMGQGFAISESTTVDHAALPRHLELGVYLKYPAQEKRTIVVLALSNEKVFDQAGMNYKGGIELSPVAFFAIRYGYIFGLGSGTPRYGFGFTSSMARLDYAISPGVGRLRFQQVTLTLCIP